MSYSPAVSSSVIVPGDANEGLQRIRLLAERLARDPEISLVEAQFNPSAAPAAIDVWKGRIPDDLLAFLSLCDGVVLRWRTVEVGKGSGRLVIPRSSELELSPTCGPEPFEYVMIDGYAGGLGSYYELTMPYDPDRAQIVYTLAENRRYHALPVCRTFIEYLALGEQRRFDSDWVDDISSTSAR